MGKDLYESNALAKELFDKADAILGFSLTDIMFNGSAEDLLQTRVTHTDVKRIGGIGDRQQILHAGLTAAATIGQAQLTYLGEAVAEIQIRSEIGHVAGGIRHEITLTIGENGMLRLH